MGSTSDVIAIETEALSLCANEQPWDSAIFERPVAVITELTVRDPSAARKDFEEFAKWQENYRYKIVSSRLGHERLLESMLLEDFGFRFIEMVLHPSYSRLNEVDLEEQGLTVAQATETDLLSIEAIAETAFVNERYFVDPRLDKERSGRRYATWAKNALAHPRQKLLKITLEGNLVAFFVTEDVGDQKCYWHLTAVAPRMQGRGLGHRTWLAMMKYHRDQGRSEVVTTISARNSVVLNLYTKLGFRFLPPEMTVHWVAD